MTFINNILLILLIVVAMILFCAILYKKTKLQNSPKFWFFILLFVASFTTNPNTLALYEIYLRLHIPVEKYKEIIYPYIEIPKPKQATNHKNIVYIYLEGMSRNFRLNEKFPNLMPNLQNLDRKIEFTNVGASIMQV